jgi:hypothetical protein
MYHSAKGFFSHNVYNVQGYFKEAYSLLFKICANDGLKALIGAYFSLPALGKTICDASFSPGGN